MKYSSPRFDRLDEDKRYRVIRAAIDEFASCGYEAANINKIAKKAHISVGSLYKYFESKEDLFLYVIQLSSDLIEEELRAINEIPFMSVESKIEKVLRIILRTNREQNSLIRLYLELISSSNNDMTEQLSFNLETFSSQCYREILTNGQTTGEVRAELDPAMAAFHLDNIFSALQYSYAGGYLHERYRIYVRDGIDLIENDEFVITETMKFLRGALLNPKD